MKLLPVACLALASALPALAAEQTCKYVDPAGNVLYSNVPQKQSRKVFCMDPAPTAMQPRRSAATTPPDRAASEAGFPRVDSGTQRRRDGDRRRILEDELAEEQHLLDVARQAMDEAGRTEVSAASADGQSSTVQGLRNVVASHERNLAAIRRELASIK